jgi:hypothetical protein
MNPEIIYLQPECEEYPEEGRVWVKYYNAEDVESAIRIELECLSDHTAKTALENVLSGLIKV